MSEAEDDLLRSDCPCCNEDDEPEPAVEVVRHDLGPLALGLARNMQEHGAENTARIEAQDKLWKYDTPEKLWYRSVRVRAETPRWRAEVISGLPPTVFQCEVFADNERHLEADLRLQYAHEVMARRLVRDWDEARARAAKALLFCGERA